MVAIYARISMKNIKKEVFFLIKKSFFLYFIRGNEGKNGRME